MSIALGAAYKIAQWANNKTIITLLIRSDDKFGILVELEYTNVEPAPLEEKEQLDKNKSKI